MDPVLGIRTWGMGIGPYGQGLVQILGLFPQHILAGRAPVGGPGRALDASTSIGDTEPIPFEHDASWMVYPF